MASTTLRTAGRPPTFDLSDVALLVPARNVAGAIEGTLNRIPTAIIRRAGALIVRDDASFDSTADVARRWAARHLDLGALVIEDDTARGQAANTVNACRDAAALGLRIAVIAAARRAGTTGTTECESGWRPRSWSRTPWR